MRDYLLDTNHVGLAVRPSSPVRKKIRQVKPAVHTDIMFGSKEVTIVATRSREDEVVLLDRGCWTERFVDD